MTVSRHRLLAAQREHLLAESQLQRIRLRADLRTMAARAEPLWVASRWALRAGSSPLGVGVLAVTAGVILWRRPRLSGWARVARALAQTAYGIASAGIAGRPR